MTFSEKVRHRFDGFWEWVEGAGMHVAGVQSLLFFWKRLGLKGLLAVLLVAGYPLGQYSLLSYVANSTIPHLAGNFGVTFEAEDWSYHPFSLKTVARDVSIRPRHDARAQPIFTAAEVEFQGSIGSTLSGLKDLFIKWRGFHTFNEVTIRHGELHLERSPTGHLNWADFAEAIPTSQRDQFLAGMYQIQTVVIDDLRVNYLEHVQGNSGGGIIQTVQARLFVDNINGTITDITRAADDRTLPTRVRLSGRLADGMLDLQGKLGLAAGDGTGSPRVPDRQLASTQPVAAGRGAPAPASVEGPYYDLTLALNHIGAAAFARTMPPTRIMATAGTISGRIALRHADPPCAAEAAMHEVRFAPNPQLVPARAEYDELTRLLKDRVVSKAYRACDALTPDGERRLPGDGPSDPGRPPDPTRRARAGGAAAFVALFNEQANDDAPPAVRSTVARDSQSLTGSVMTASYRDAVVPTSIDGAVGMTVDAAAANVSRRINNGLAGKTGKLGIAVLPARGAAGAAPAQETNAVTKGVKGIGRGIKRLFGGGRDKPKKAQPKKPSGG